MRSDLSWHYRTPPIEPWWYPILDAIEPIGELVVLGLGIVAAYLLALFLVVL